MPRPPRLTAQTGCASVESGAGDQQNQRSAASRRRTAIEERVETMSKNRLSISTLAAIALTGVMGAAAAQPVTLTIESWRNDDLAIWRGKIIPAFEKQHPNIKVRFAPTAPTEYNAVLNSKLEAGTAGDLITCRPFDVPLQH